MLYSHNLLKRYLSLHQDTQSIADQLTLKVCEVEEIHERRIPDLVVIGKVTAVTKHPNADTLFVCQLDCGDKGQYQICTGGENVVADSRVPVALPGCYLPSINLTIEPREMRGEASHGMICSKAELGIPEDVEEHWIRTMQYGSSHDLTKVAQAPDMDDLTDKDLGTPLGEKYPRLHNWTLDIENKTITHRPDLFGHFGISNELCAIFPEAIQFHGGKKYQEQMQQPLGIYETLDHSTKAKRGLDIRSDKVHTYTLLELNNINRQKSDLYLRSLLHDLSIQPKANWVDFSNIFMYLTGQPIHFFDAAKVNGDIIVRQAEEGEAFTDLFDAEHVLTTADIVIADKDKILALAGIVGSNTSGVDENTTDILVEIANFDHIQVRKTGTRLGLRTDAELRFEKQINPLYTLNALTMLLDELSYFGKSIGSYELGGLSRWVNSADQTQVINRIELDTAQVERMLYGGDGVAGHIEDKDILKILTSLGCKVSDERLVTIPSWRGPADLTNQADLIEELARIIGFDALPTLAYQDESRFVPYSQDITRQRALEDLLAGQLGFDQVETYPWFHERRHSHVDTEQLYTLTNPLAPEQKYLRNTLRQSMLEVLEKNGPFFDSFKIFDTGNTWEQGREEKEHKILACLIRKKDSKDWKQSTFLELKGVVSKVLHTLEAKGRVSYDAPDYDGGAFHPKQLAIISLNKQVIGSIKTIHPALLEGLKLPPTGSATVLELDLELLKGLAKPSKAGSTAKYTTLQDQIVVRDLNFVVSQDQQYGSITDAVSKVKEVSGVEVFDLYQGEHLDPGMKSIALRISIQAKKDEQLTTEQINEVMQKAIASVEKVGGKLR